MILEAFGVTNGIYPINYITRMLSSLAIHHTFINIVSLLFGFLCILSILFIFILLLFGDFRSPCR